MRRERARTGKRGNVSSAEAPASKRQLDLEGTFELRAVRLPPEREGELEVTLGATETTQEIALDDGDERSRIEQERNRSPLDVQVDDGVCARGSGWHGHDVRSCRPGRRAEQQRPPIEVDLPAAGGDDIRAQDRRALVNRRDDVMEGEVAADPSFRDETSRPGALHAGRVLDGRQARGGGRDAKMFEGRLAKRGMGRPAVDEQQNLLAGRWMVGGGDTAERGNDVRADLRERFVKWQLP